MSVSFNPCIVLRANYCRVKNFKASASAAYTNSRAFSSFRVLSTAAQRNARYISLFSLQLQHRLICSPTVLCVALQNVVAFSACVKSK